MNIALTTDKYTVKVDNDTVAIEHVDHPDSRVECLGARAQEVMVKIEQIYGETGNSKSRFYPVANAYFDSLYFD